MLLARVIGSVVATAKDEGLRGHKLLVLRLVDAAGADLAGVRGGRTLVALDAVGAGVGELVYCCRGKEASLAWPEGALADAAVVGIVDPGRTDRRADQGGAGCSSGA